ncbi:hypothetical protein QVD17_37349 [Tagetes erecta]|uniref:Wall-associated receptor kinase galacturonan-binding domain-containing protein n=1 Tax=Tagetes erecta TaxID=13708 RepID=A0AAD8NI91_TARER|nr:hypothetical protein QVD17_37349 [Tagetes erecta]
MNHLLIFHILCLILSTTKPTEALSLAKKGCQERCGKVEIPFPFGIGEHCAFDKWYIVDCNSSIPYLSAFNNIQVLNVSLEKQTITVNVSTISDCQNQVLDSNQILLSKIYNTNSSVSPFLISNFHNIFVVMGCGNAAITNVEGGTITGCSTTCRNDTSIDLKNCYGVRCCQATLPSYLRRFNLNLTRLENHGGDGTCGSAFLVDKESFLNGNFSLEKDHYAVPLSLFWTVPTFTHPECTELKIRLHDGSTEGYRKCKCDISEEGNPYLPNGCKKLDKCKECERWGGVCSSFNMYTDATSQVILRPTCDYLDNVMHPPQKSKLGVVLEGREMSMFDPVVVNEDSKGVLLAIANLAMRCLNANGKYRPTMKEVAIELEGIRMSHVPSTVQTSDDLLMHRYNESTSITSSFKDTIN